MVVIFPPSAKVAAGLVVGAATLGFLTETSYPQATTIPMPASPAVQSRSECDRYRVELHSLRASLLHESGQCMRVEPVKIGYGLECPGFSGETVRRTLRAYPQCDYTEATMCRVNAALSHQVKACYANAKVTESSKEIVIATEQSRQLQSAWGIYQNLKELTNPSAFVSSWVKGRVSDGVLSEIQDQRGQFTQRGQTMLQEAYEWLFQGTIGNVDVRSTNPIISAIQGEAAEKIRAAHSQAISEWAEVEASLSSFNSQSSQQSNTRSLISLGSVETGKLHPEECRLLDGPQADRMAVERPEAFDALMKKCI